MMIMIVMMMFIIVQDDEEDEPRARRRRLADMAAMEDEPMEEEGVESIENLEDTKGKPIREWVALAGPRREVYNRFRNFLRTYVDADRDVNLYQEKIKEMCQKNKASFEVDYNVLASECQVMIVMINMTVIKIMMMPGARLLPPRGPH